jgi:hypothetical protein
LRHLRTGTGDRVLATRRARRPPPGLSTRAKHLLFGRQRGYTGSAGGCGPSRNWGRPCVGGRATSQLAGLQRCGSRCPRDSQPEATILNAKESGADTQIRTADLLFTK